MTTHDNALIRLTLAWASVGMAPTTTSAQQSEEQSPCWARVWEDPTMDSRIRGLIWAVGGQRMTEHLFYLSEDPLPYRKLNFTLPGHEKNTLYEADDYVARQLES